MVPFMILSPGTYFVRNEGNFPAQNQFRYNATIITTNLYTKLWGSSKLFDTVIKQIVVDIVGANLTKTFSFVILSRFLISNILVV